MRTVHELPKGGKPGPRGIYQKLFTQARVKSLRFPDKWVLVRSYPGDQSAYEVKSQILRGEKEVPGGAKRWEIKAHRVPRGERAEVGCGSQLFAKWIGGKDE